MATYDNLPVYKESYDLLMLIMSLLPLYPKSYKYTLGSKIQQECVDLISHIFKANSSEHKGIHLQQARESIETIRLLCRLSKDLRLLDLKYYVKISQHIESISKQLTAWQRSVK